MSGEPEVINAKRRVGLKDVARAAQVSVATVSMAMSDHPRVNEETKRRIRLLCAKMGYRSKVQRQVDQGSAPDRAERSSRRRLRRVGFMLLGTEIQNVLNASILQSLMAQCAQEDIAIQIGAVDRPEDLATAPMRTAALARDVDGLILMGWVTSEVLAALDQEGVVYVVLGHAMSPYRPKMHSVCFDEITMGQICAEALLKSGHRRIALLGEVMPKGLYYWRWRTGYAAALLDAGLPVDPALTCMSGKVLDSGAALAKMVLSMSQTKRPTGFLIPNARVAVGFVAAMAKLGVELPSEAVVISADTLVREQIGAQAYPYVECHHELMATMGLAQLSRVFQEPGLPGSTIHVPFMTHHLPSSV